MKRAEKSREGPAKKQENLGEKLRRRAVVGKRGGQSTPVLSPWRLLQATHQEEEEEEEEEEDFNNNIKVPLCLVSARKLGAAFWELQHYRLPLSESRMHHSRPPPPRILRHSRLYKDSTPFHLPDPSPSSPDLPGSASSLRRLLAASLMKHHRSNERNTHALQPVSPASYGSSMEVAPYDPAITPTSSLDIKGRVGEAGCSLKTSTELLKVLNRIWSLEEQHASNMSVVKGLKKELDHARARIKELVRDQQADRHEIEELRNQIAENKLIRKSKEHDRVSIAIQSVRDELEDERKLRKHSESLHRKLARELYEVKTSLASALKELERERTSRKLLEDLCDEFAWGIRDYEQQVHALKQKSNEDWVDTADHGRLILHISESWLDERMQMKLGSHYHFGEKNSIVDRLRSEIGTFLKAKQYGNSKSYGYDNFVPRNNTFRRSSLESIPLKVAASAPQDVGDEEDSTDSDSHCFELNRPTAGSPKPQGHEPEEDQTYDMVKPTHLHKNLPFHEKVKRCSPTSLQVKFEEQMPRTIPWKESESHVLDAEQCKIGEGNPVEARMSRKSEICEVTEEDDYQGKTNADETHVSKPHHVVDDLIRNQYLLSEHGDTHLENNYGVVSSGNSVWRRPSSPIRQWTATLPSQDCDISESSSKLPKENTLKARLLEARKRGQRSLSRLKASKVPV
ncbi:uncharacterized protein At5g41620-like [Diospyros lotus]|uniref:uncharacterized protein At5g41620-like n=1 Tax=Diospyros lotus TaxID=55363 RepID=UPI0022586A96|nr:uncharacterized protein At5g41620-like [Diospyros lotus]